MAQSTPFTSPVGRLVQGDAFEAQTKDANGALRVVKTGPNIGQPAPQFFVALAIPKTDPAWPGFWAILDAAARQGFPHLFPTPGGPCVNPQFSFKVKDGDGIDQNGKNNADKEGFAGCWVVSFSSAYAPKVYQPTAPGVYVEITTGVKRGDFVRVAGTVSGNDNAQRPGIYVNLNMIELVGVGAAITSGPSAAEAFATPAALPVGAAPLPVAGPGPVGPGPVAAPAPAVPQAYAPPAAAPPLPVAASPAPAAAPYAGYMAAPAPAGPGAPAPTAAPAAPPHTALPTASPSKVMLPAANGVAYEAYVAAGWTDDQMRASGYLQ